MVHRVASEVALKMRSIGRPDGMTENAAMAVATALVKYIMKGGNPKELLEQQGDAQTCMDMIADCQKRKKSEVFEEKIAALERLDNTGDKFYTGNLRNAKGKVDLRGVEFTPAGKTEIFLNGDGPIEKALRSALLQNWLQTEAVDEVQRKLRVDSIHAADKRKSAMAKQAAWDQRKKALCDHQGMDANKAQGAAANGDKILYEAITQGQTSAQKAVLIGKRKATPADLDNPTSDLKRKIRNVKVAKSGTVYFNAVLSVMRYQSTALVQQGVPVAEASRLVAEDAKEKETYSVPGKDPTDPTKLVPLPQEEQVQYNKPSVAGSL